MRRNITNIFLSFIALVAMTASCTKFLTEEPKTFDSPDTYYTTIDEMQSAVNGCYDGLTTAFTGVGLGLALNTHVFFEGLTGLCWREQAGSGQFMGFDLPILENQDGANSTIWQLYYKAIENCNSTIYGIENSTASVAESTKATLLSEVYFLRAYYYWRLVTMFGPIPYKVEKTLGTANSALPLDTEETVINGCIEDLKHAEELAADSWNRTDGHVSKGAIKSLLAKLYMQKAGHPVNDKASYALAYEKAKEVVNSGAFSLFSSYADLRNQANENMGEFIFSIQREKEHAGNYVVSNCFPLTAPFIAATVNNGGGFVPNQSFVDSYEDGPRKDAFFFTSYPSFEDPSVTVEFPPHVFKFFDESSDALKDNRFGMDYWVIRYADVLLLMAEAKAMADGGSTSDAAAINAYHQVRSRAVNGAEKPSSITFNQVFKERIHELAFENISWFDMTRNRKAYDPVKDQVVDIIGHVAEGHDKHAFTETDMYLPYPMRERKYNPNLVR